MAWSCSLFRNNALISALLLALVGVSGCAQSNEVPRLAGEVIKIVDGDTLDVQLDTGPIRVRLHAADTPERGQPHFKEASDALSGLVLSKKVEIEPFEQDRYDRLVGIIHMDGMNVNAELIRMGHAWAFRRYMRKSDAELCSLEADARSAKVGVWALDAHERVAPWEYRSRRNRESFTDYSNETVAMCVSSIGEQY